jgi:hypothetical protein
MRRSGYAALLALAAVLGLAACGGGGGESGGAHALVVADAIPHAFKRDVDVPRSYNDPLTAITQLAAGPEGARPWLVELYGHGQPVDRAIANGLCAGMAQLKDFPADARAGNWREFVAGYAGRFGANVPASAAEPLVEEILQVWPLDQLAPETAAGYWRACRV